MLSIIIPARNNGKGTRDCVLSAIYSADKLKLNCQFILIDDLSEPSDGILDVFREVRNTAGGRHEFDVVRTGKHEHYTGVFSIGLSLARRENAFFLSNDMLITPSFFQAVLGVAALSREIGIVRGTSPYTDSHPEYIVPMPSDARTYNDVESFSKTVFEQNGLSFAEDPHLSGDAILIKRAVIDAIGVLDVRFFGYFGDVDFGMRAHLAKFKLVCARGAWLFHSGEGHVKGDVDNKKGEITSLRSQRMDLVRQAFAEFRRKWGDVIPVEYKGNVTLRTFFALAEQSTGKVPLKCELPASTLAQLQRL